jgi:hypothetical protein
VAGNVVVQVTLMAVDIVIQSLLILPERDTTATLAIIHEQHKLKSRPGTGKLRSKPGGRAQLVVCHIRIEDRLPAGEVFGRAIAGEWLVVVKMRHAWHSPLTLALMMCLYPTLMNRLIAVALLPRQEGTWFERV